MILEREKLFHQFTRQKKEIHLPIRFNSKDQILICLPEKNHSEYSKKELIQEYRDLLSNYKVQFVASTDCADEIQGSINCIFYDKTSFSFWKKLPKNFKTLFIAKQFRAAIDLNVEFSLIVGMICEATRAPFLMSFDKPNAQIFFNILVGNNNNSFKDSLFLIKSKLQSLSNINN